VRFTAALGALFRLRLYLPVLTIGILIGVAANASFALRFNRDCALKTDSVSSHGRFKLRLLLQQGQNFFHQCVGSDAVFFAQDWNRAVLDELIGPADAHHRRVDHL
jgi:hypothetical protein